MKNEALEFAMHLQSDFQPCYAGVFSTAKMMKNMLTLLSKKGIVKLPIKSWDKSL